MTRRRPGPAARRARLRAAALVLVAALTAGSCSPLFQGSAPQRRGTLALPGLAAPVEIVRDAFGVPHVFARNDHDLWFAQGVVHAQDRLFQMDLERRLARGELAELFGEPALPADRLFRHLGFGARAPAVAASWPAETRRIVAAYCDGVNAAMAALAAWPVEFRVLRSAPRRFTPEDVAAGSLLKSFGLAQWSEELIAYRLAARLPREKFEEIMPRTPAESPVVVPGFGPAASGPAPTVLVEGLASARETVGGIPKSGGSNAWAVSGKKSVSGKPILASDPHLLLACPSVWYEIHLVAPGIDVYGVSFPGAPCVVIGHNPRIAWGFTNVMLDDADFFVERVDGDRVMHRKAWVPMTRRTETIRVAGGRAETVTVRETPHGPILSPVLPGVTSALALRWAGYDGGDPIAPLARLDRARNREEFLAALSAFPHPAQNVVYADAAGTIGVAMAGRIPVRKGGSGMLPVPGDTGEWDWNGYVPFPANPRVFDPPQGFVVAANVPPAGVKYPHYVSRLYEPPDRGRRISEVLAADDRFSVEKIERLQSDVVRKDAERAVGLALRVAQTREPESPLFRDARRLLGEWNLDVSARSPAAALYEVFSEMLIEEIFRDDMGDDLYEEFRKSSRLAWNAVDRVLARGDSLFLENVRTGRGESLDDVVARALVRSMTFLKERLGTVTATWSWGKLHQATFEHPFGKKRYLQRWFNIGPNAVGGDGRTVLKEEFRGGTGFAVVVGPSMRQVVPLGHRPMARSVITTGASGHFFEKHYRDQAPLWLGGKSHPAWTDPGELAANTEAKLVLVPAKRSGT